MRKIPEVYEMMTLKKKKSYPLMYGIYISYVGKHPAQQLQIKLKYVY